jgi:nucleoside-diphosphate-sugar epimerase
MDNRHKTALIVGAHGVIGGNLARHLETLEDWSVIGLSRRGGTSTEKIRYISVDLLNPADSMNKLADLTEVTHIFYAAYQDRPSWAELVAPNLAMLVNVVEAIETAAPNLRPCQPDARLQGLWRPSRPVQDAGARGPMPGRCRRNS